MNIGIICEYNPFHNGHKYQIDKIRQEFGEDANIIALMSGNYVQRGGVAIADKGIRAKCAILSGANLVLELPFPFSMGSAEFFARSAIHILNEINCIDYVSFGSESGSLEDLVAVAEIMLSDEFSERIKVFSDSPDTKKFGHAAIYERALNDIYPSNTVNLTPNNILAIEYIKAIKELRSNIKLHTIKRIAADFSNKSIINGSIQSATAIRQSIFEKDISALEYIPDITKNIYLEAISNGEFPCDNDILSSAIISNLRINSSECVGDIQDTSGGLYNRLRDIGFETNSIDSLICSAESKKFTKARIRRALFYSLLGVTSSQLKELPQYSQILALDSKGRAILKTIGKRSGFTILTKPSDTDKLSVVALEQKRRSDISDSVFELTKPIPKSGRSSLRFTPFVKK